MIGTNQLDALHRFAETMVAALVASIELEIVAVGFGYADYVVAAEVHIASHRFGSVDLIVTIQQLLEEGNLGRLEPFRAQAVPAV